jgi:hypothetical protein
VSCAAVAYPGQVIDSGLGADHKRDLANELDTWLEDPDNLDKWESGKFPASDKRILLTCWVANVWAKFTAEHDAKEAKSEPTRVIKAFWKTGCGMTADGTNDELIHPEGTVNYKFEQADANKPVNEAVDLINGHAQPASDESNQSDGESEWDADDVDEDEADGVPVEAAEDNIESVSFPDALPGDLSALCAELRRRIQTCVQCPAVGSGLRTRLIMFKWPLYGWWVGRVAKSIDRDGFNAVVDYDISQHRHLLVQNNYVRTLNGDVDPTSPDGSWCLLDLVR